MQNWRSLSELALADCHFQYWSFSRRSRSHAGRISSLITCIQQRLLVSRLYLSERLSFSVAEYKGVYQNPKVCTCAAFLAGKAMSDGFAISYDMHAISTAIAGVPQLIQTKKIRMHTLSISCTLICFFSRVRRAASFLVSYILVPAASSSMPKISRGFIFSTCHHHDIKSLNPQPCNCVRCHHMKFIGISA